MASYIDSCAIITSGTALAIYQAAFAGTAHALSNIQFGALESSLTLCIAIASIIGGRLGDLYGRKKVFAVTMCFIILGALMVTFILTQLLYCCGAAFAFESILKVWMQECFPTLLRTTANGAIVFSSRLCCAAFGLFTASIIAFNVKLAFILLALFCVIGFASAILVFRKRRYNTFEEDDAAAAEVPESKEA